MRRPIPTLGEPERIRRLAALGRGPDLQPLHPDKREQAMAETSTEIPAQSVPTPAAGAVLKQPVVQVLTVVAIAATAALAASEAGVLPPWVGAVAQGVIGLLAAFGIASPGIRRKP